MRAVPAAFSPAADDSVMVRTRIKFCGLRRAVDVRQAVALGVDAIGLVCVPGSKRHVTPAQAARLRERVPVFVSVVVLVMDASVTVVREIVRSVQPDLLQFHGSEDAAFCARFGLPYVKAVSMAQPAYLRKALCEHRASQSRGLCRGLVLDSHMPGGMGGSGKPFDWSRVQRSALPLIVAGGLSADNVGDAISRLQPFAVDVSSGVESAPGVKDESRMRAFVAAVQAADRQRAQ